jgi:hypothetical protein
MRTIPSGYFRTGIEKQPAECELASSTQVCQLNLLAHSKCFKTSFDEIRRNSFKCRDSVILG